MPAMCDSRNLGIGELVVQLHARFADVYLVDAERQEQSRFVRLAKPGSNLRSQTV